MTDGLGPVQGDDGPLVLRGGVGGIRFQWEELEEAARVLALLATDTEDVAAALTYLDRDLADLPWRILHLQPPGGVAGPSYQAALAHLDAAWTSALDNGRTLSATGDRLSASLLAYRLADGVAVAVTEAARSRNAATARALARGAIDSGAVEVGPIELHGGDTGADVAFDGTVTGVVDRLAAVEAEDPGTFEVLRAGTAADPVYVVVLPGTQAGRVRGDGSNPFDAGGIAEAVGEDSRFTGAAVLDALEQAGARDGDALLIAGYSQGGLHAVNLAGPDGLGGRYDVQLVLTVGAPTGIHASGASEYLHLEHRDDAVPRLDTLPNEDGRHRTTVGLDNPVPGPGRRDGPLAGRPGLGPAHTLANYAAGARLVDASDAPSLAPAAALLATAAATGTARRYSFTATRRPDPPRAAAPPRGPRDGGSRLNP
ncbi:hypothetical protein [Arthrobacter sp. B0490]|uniref:hypothetical protein n=1 Tax=Arthrobacter sp. B0490 TaxID=2058891 RepID=UPI000CE34911|nr:hypothetical protein [Arthrobacter sp. B0490]